MRRLIALVPAMLLVLTLAPAAQAGEGVKTTTCHSTQDPSLTGATLELGWTESGVLTSNNRPVMLLTRLTVTNTCTITWARIRLWGLNFPGVTFDDVNMVVAPNTTRTLRRWALTRLGLWDAVYSNWFIRARGSVKDACGYGQLYPYVIWADGHITRDCHG